MARKAATDGGPATCRGRKTGELAIMAAGDSAIIDKVMPVLRAMGTSVLRTGAVGLRPRR
jgi:3-hydroxyisobutyrate dehydrogenase-like beta-hydroxyacid dehydrogenase